MFLISSVIEVLMVVHFHTASMIECFGVEFLFSSPKCSVNSSLQSFISHPHLPLHANSSHPLTLRFPSSHHPRPTPHVLIIPPPSNRHPLPGTTPFPPGLTPHQSGRTHHALGHGARAQILPGLGRGPRDRLVAGQERGGRGAEEGSWGAGEVERRVAGGIGGCFL